MQVWFVEKMVAKKVTTVPGSRQCLTAVAAPEFKRVEVGDESERLL